MCPRTGHRPRNVYPNPPAPETQLKKGKLHASPSLVGAEPEWGPCGGQDVCLLVRLRGGVAVRVQEPPAPSGEEHPIVPGLLKSATPPASGAGLPVGGRGCSRVGTPAPGAGTPGPAQQGRGWRVRACLSRALFCSGRWEGRLDAHVEEEPGLGGVPWWRGAGLDRPEWVWLQSSVSASASWLSAHPIPLSPPRSTGPAGFPCAVWEAWASLASGPGPRPPQSPLWEAGVSAPPSRAPLAARLTGGRRVSLLPWTSKPQSVGAAGHGTTSGPAHSRATPSVSLYGVCERQGPWQGQVGARRGPRAARARAWLCLFRT